MPYNVENTYLFLHLIDENRSESSYKDEERSLFECSRMEWQGCLTALIQFKSGSPG